MKLLFENWRGYLKEYGAAGMGGNIATLAGAGLQPMASIVPGYKKPVAQGDDLPKSLKVIIYRNDKVLLLKNDRGWDLPGGHMKQDESLVDGLKREVFEETGLTITDPQDLNVSHDHEEFYSAQLPTDDVILSDEHSEYGFFTVEQIKEMNDVADFYKKAIYQTMGYKPVENKITEIKIIIGA
jgi:ADP-ribose pyrophosphatase YjhB (NUDIX family)